MDKAQEKYLVDVQLAIERIDIYLQGKRDWFLFDKNITIQSAVVNYLPKLSKEVNMLLSS